MPKRSKETRYLRTQKCEEFIEKYFKGVDVENIEDIKIAFVTAFNIGYTVSRDLIRNNIDDIHTYDRCKSCHCLALVYRDTVLCVDCTGVNNGPQV